MISVVIPALNEEKALPATLERLLPQTRGHEVIVVDGGSSDGTSAIARSHPEIHVMSAPRGRASQMNAGARRARGEWLLFLHADTVLPHDALTLIEGLPRETQAGGFRHRFSGSGWRLRLVSLVDNVRCATTRIIYGDQAMFVRRSLFQRLGGFPHRAILEDVYFCVGLVKATSPVILPREVVTDSRKFVKLGIGRSFLRCTIILLCVSCRLPIPRVGLEFFHDVR